jgi:hypothetical protein
VPGEWYVALGHALGKTWRGVPNMIGISYLAFRCSRLVLEVRNGVVKKPNFLEYLNFAFFLPTMPVGPINTYANFRRGFAERMKFPWAARRCASCRRGQIRVPRQPLQPADLFRPAAGRSSASLDGSAGGDAVFYLYLY